MATIKVDKIFEGDVKVEYLINITGADGAVEQSIIDVSALTAPDKTLGNWRPVLLEANWNIHPGYDAVNVFYHDEGNDESIIRMTGDSYDSRIFSGGGTIDVEAATPTEDDYDVLFDLLENGDEDANAAAQIHLIFKKRSSNA